MMLKNKRIQLYQSLLLFSLLIAAGSALGAEQPANQQLTGEKPGYTSTIPGLNDADLLTNSWLPAADDVWTDDTEQTRFLAQADKEPEGEEKPLSPECAAFRKDPDADIGDIIRAGCQPTLGQMSALMDNPLGNVAMLFTQFDISVLENPTSGREENKVNYMGIFQFPKGISENWNLINRIVWNVPSMPLDQDKIDAAVDRLTRRIGSGEGPIVLPPANSPIAPIDLFGGRTTGFGDMYYNGLFAPKVGKKLESGANLLWGAGVALGFPTASEDILGTGKWLAGPSALGVYMGPKWKIGALWQQYFDYAGDDDRDDVNLTNLQYFIFYSIDEVTSIGLSPNIIANWEQSSGNVWTVPIGLGISRTFQFGKVPVRIGAEVHYSIVQPDDVVGQKWNFRFYVIPAAPSALFKWMQ
jgi:hypothetical protein